MRKRGEAGGTRSESERKEEARNVVHKGVEADSSKGAREPKKKPPEKRYGRDGENERDPLQNERKREKERERSAEKLAASAKKEKEKERCVCVRLSIYYRREAREEAKGRVGVRAKG